MLQNVILNEAEVLKTWGGFITESTGITDRSKQLWMAKYCAFHDMNEKAQLNESVHGYAHMNPNMNVGGMGAINLPNNAAATPGIYGEAGRGSGDNPFSLLPLAVQVAAQTIALDLVPVVPMQGPLGILQYMDYVYEGGRTGLRPAMGAADASATAPALVKVKFGTKVGNDWKALDAKVVAEALLSDSSDKSRDMFGILEAHPTFDVDGFKLTLVAFGRIDGRPIFAVEGLTGKDASDVAFGGEATGKSLWAALSAKGIDGMAVMDVDTVKALEDYVPGFTGKGLKEGKAKAYTREEGESTPSKMMSLNTFTLEVKAKTIQVKGAITREQIQDLKAYGIDAVAQVEAELVNELTQHINRELLTEIFVLGRQNHDEALAWEGVNLNTFFTTDIDEAKNGVDGFVSSYVGGGAETLGTIQRRIMSKILAASNLIAQRGRRGAGTFAVCSAAIATALQDCAGFVAYPLSNTINQNAGSLYPVGAISGVSIYVDPNLTWDCEEIVVGRKGKDNEPGLVFMPYLMADKLSYPSEGMEGAPVTSLKSRYAIVAAGHHPQLYYYTFQVKCGAGVSLI